MTGQTSNTQIMSATTYCSPVMLPKVIHAHMPGSSKGIHYAKAPIIFNIWQQNSCWHLCPASVGPAFTYYSVPLLHPPLSVTLFPFSTSRMQFLNLCSALFDDLSLYYHMQGKQDLLSLCVLPASISYCSCYNCKVNILFKNYYF